VNVIKFARVLAYRAIALASDRGNDVANAPLNPFACRFPSHEELLQVFLASGVGGFEDGNEASSFRNANNAVR
jgi:hypothetical protein